MISFQIMGPEMGIRPRMGAIFHFYRPSQLAAPIWPPYITSNTGKLPVVKNQFFVD